MFSLLPQSPCCLVFHYAKIKDFSQLNHSHFNVDLTYTGEHEKNAKEDLFCVMIIVTTF